MVEAAPTAPSAISSKLSLEVTAAELFHLCDSTGDGVVTLQDLQKVAKDISLDEEQLNEVFQTLDPNNLGKLSQSEFIAALEKYLNQAISRRESLSSDKQFPCHDKHQGITSLPSTDLRSRLELRDYLVAETCSSSSSSSQDLESHEIDRLIQTLKYKLAQEQADKRLLEEKLAQKDRNYNSQLSLLLSEAEEQVRAAKGSFQANKDNWVPVTQFEVLRNTVEELTESNAALLRQKEALQSETRHLSFELVEKHHEINEVKQRLAELEDTVNTLLEDKTKYKNDNNNNNKENNNRNCINEDIKSTIKTITNIPQKESRSTSIDESQFLTPLLRRSSSKLSIPDLQKSLCSVPTLTHKQCQCRTCSNVSLINDNSLISAVQVALNCDNVQKNYFPVDFDNSVLGRRRRRSSNLIVESTNTTSIDSRGAVRPLGIITTISPESISPTSSSSTLIQEVSRRNSRTSTSPGVPYDSLKTNLLKPKTVPISKRHVEEDNSLEKNEMELLLDQRASLLQQLSGLQGMTRLLTLYKNIS